MAGERLEVRQSARLVLQPRAGLATISAPSRSWPMKETKPPSCSLRVAGLPMSWRRAPKRSASPRVSSSASGSASSARTSAATRPRTGRDRPRPRAASRAPRACARGRRGGGWGSARRRAAPRAPAAPPRCAELVEQLEAAQRVGAGDQQAQLRELALARPARAAGAASRAQARRSPGSISKPSAAREPGGAQHPQRVVREGAFRRRPAAAAPRGRRPPVGIDRLASRGRRAGRRSR